MAPQTGGAQAQTPCPSAACLGQVLQCCLPQPHARLPAVHGLLTGQPGRRPARAGTTRLRNHVSCKQRAPHNSMIACLWHSASGLYAQLKPHYSHVLRCMQTGITLAPTYLLKVPLQVAHPVHSRDQGAWQLQVAGWRHVQAANCGQVAHGRHTLAVDSRDPYTRALPQGSSQKRRTICGLQEQPISEHKPKYNCFCAIRYMCDVV